MKIETQDLICSWRKNGGHHSVEIDTQDTSDVLFVVELVTECIMMTLTNCLQESVKIS